MAELLIKAVDATHDDPTKDQRGCYKRGDIVVVRADGWGWGTQEVIPPASGGLFVVVKITDVTPNQIKNWVKNNWDSDIEGLDMIGGRRRRVRIDVRLLPVGVRNTLNNTGTYSTTWAAIRQYVRNKQTNNTASGVVIE